MMRALRARCTARDLRAPCALVAARPVTRAEENDAWFVGFHQGRNRGVWLGTTTPTASAARGRPARRRGVAVPIFENGDTGGWAHVAPKTALARRRVRPAQAGVPNRSTSKSGEIQAREGDPPSARIDRNGQVNRTPLQYRLAREDAGQSSGIEPQATAWRPIRTVRLQRLLRQAEKRLLGSAQRRDSGGSRSNTTGQLRRDRVSRHRRGDPYGREVPNSSVSIRLDNGATAILLKRHLLRSLQNALLLAGLATMIEDVRY